MAEPIETRARPAGNEPIRSRPDGQTRVPDHSRHDSERNSDAIGQRRVRARAHRVRRHTRRWNLKKALRRAELVVVLGVTTVVAYACKAGEAEEAVPADEYELIQRRTLNIVAEAVGQIEPIRVVEVKSKASGEILELPVETGDRVERGTLLARVDPRDVQNSYNQALVDRDVAQARLRNSQAQLERTKELRAANVATDQELESAEFDEANSRAQLVRAEANLLLAEERLKDVTITAPINGVIIERPIEVGTIIASASQNVSGGTTLMKMADLETMQVRALIDETDLGKILPGLPVSISVDAYPERRFEGSVLKIEPQAVIEQNVTMFPILVQLDNTSGLLKVGMNADIQVQIATRENVIVVPSSAVVATRDAAAAAFALGIDEETLNAALRPQAARTAAAEASPECAPLLAKMREGGLESLTDAERASLRDCAGSQASGERQFAQGSRASGQRGSRAGGGGRSNRSGIGSSAQQVRTGVAFVTTATGFEPRSLRLGLNDWEYTEVLSGLEEGEEVVIISVARLQQSQQDFLDRIRERATGNGPIPGAGGTHMPPSGGRGGRGR